VVSRSAPPVAGHVEGVGQFARHPGLARRPAEPAGRVGHAVARKGLRVLRRRRRLCDGVRGARRDLRHDSRRGHHRILTVSGDRQPSPLSAKRCRRCHSTRWASR
jgi:hypothetical protein